ncbi:uncharacterized protein LOC128908634 [Rissa tridactyla]|uniref:uncharacterized protein LOC128908634 n=1 Tax=Rissa tridactyla TaxID=75485 RepID=UPI0023BA6424|nr:uncharacterized protein LOC128908634 [Rissa tridactyla]
MPSSHIHKSQAVEVHSAFVCPQNKSLSHLSTPKWKRSVKAYLLKLEKTCSFQLVSRFSHIVNKNKNHSRHKITVVTVKRESDEHLEAQKADAMPLDPVRVHCYAGSQKYYGDFMALSKSRVWMTIQSPKHTARKHIPAQTSTCATPRTLRLCAKSHEVYTRQPAAPAQGAEPQGSAVYLPPPPCAAPSPGARSPPPQTSPAPAFGRENSTGGAAGRTRLRGGEGRARRRRRRQRDLPQHPAPAALPPPRRVNSRRCPAAVFSPFPRQKGRRSGGGTRSGSGVSPHPPCKRRPAGGAGGAEGEAGTEGTKAAGNKERQLEPKNTMSCRSISQSWLQLDCSALANTCHAVLATNQHVYRCCQRGWQGTAMDQPSWKMNIWKLREQGSHLLPTSVQNELPGWMHGTLGKRPAEQHCRLQSSMVKTVAAAVLVLQCICKSTIVSLQLRPHQSYRLYPRAPKLAGASQACCIPPVVWHLSFALFFGSWVRETCQKTLYTANRSRSWRNTAWWSNARSGFRNLQDV